MLICVIEDHKTLKILTWKLNFIFISNTRSILGFPGNSAGKESVRNAGDPPIQFLGGEDPLEKGSATHPSILGLPWRLSWWRIHLQCRRPGFYPWAGKILWRREWLSTPVFWLGGGFHGLYNLWDSKELDTTEWLSLRLILMYLSKNNVF